MAPRKKMSPTATRDGFLAEIEKFLDETGMYPTRFGTEAVGDSRFVPRLRRPGSDVKASTIDRCRIYMAQHDAGA